MKLRQERRGSEVPIARKYLLTSLLFCGICGTGLNGSAKRDRASAPLRRVYHCRVAGDTTRRHGCGGVTRNANALDWFVTETALFRLASPALAKLLGEPNGDSDAGLSSMLAERRHQQDRVHGLVDDYASGLLDRPQFSRAKATAEARLHEIDEQIEVTNRSRTARGLVPIGQTLRAAWDASESDSWRRSILSLVIERVVVHPGKQKPFVPGTRWRFAPELISIEWRV